MSWEGSRAKNMSQNKYVFFENSFRQSCDEIDVSAPDCLDRFKFGYFGRVLHRLEPLIAGRGLEICVTGWTVKDLPVYGPNVISCILIDEFAREPRYRDKVGLIFRTCGLRPDLGNWLGYGGPADAASGMAAYAKARYLDRFGRPLSRARAFAGKPLAPVLEIPFGYRMHGDDKMIPISDRTQDVFFAGSVNHISNRKTRYLSPPKELSRNRMLAALDDLKSSHRDINTVVTLTEGYVESLATSPEHYLQGLMNTKIVPTPRGTTLETSRYYEAMRYGCIPIGERFARSAFLNDAPHIEIDDWSDMSHVIPDLLADEKTLSRLHQDCCDWWNSICAEDVIARGMAEQILAHTCQVAPARASNGDDRYPVAP